MLCISPSFAQKVNPNAGTSSADFLKIPVGARAIGMGETFTAIADDVNALYWNPAGLAGQKYANLGFSHDESFQGLRHEFLGHVQPKADSSRGGVWGVGALSLIVPSDIERRSGLNENDPFNPISSPEGKFGAYDLALMASYGQMWNERHSFGATVKFIRQSIDTRSAQTGAIDLGWRSHDEGPWTFGAVVQNFGPGVRFGAQYPLPLTFRWGAAYEVYPRSHLALEVSAPRDDYPTIALGSEWALGRLFSLRAGYDYRWYGNPLGNMAGLRTGLGLALQSFSMDYAFVPFGDLGNEHRISIGWRFGAPRLAPKAEAAAPAGDPAAAKTESVSAPVAPAPPAPVPAPPVPAAPAAAPPAGPAPAPQTVVAPAPPAADEGFIKYRIVAQPKVVSARGTDYLVQAKAPSGESLRRIEYRSFLPATDRLSLEVVQEYPESLPAGFKALSAFRIKVQGQLAARSVAIEFSVPESVSKPAVLALVDGKWQTLTMETVKQGPKTLVRARSAMLPEHVALAAGN